MITVVVVYGINGILVQAYSVLGYLKVLNYAGTYVIITLGPVFFYPFPIPISG